MLCEIINPSDPYTMQVDDFHVGAVAIMLVGRGQLGLTSIDDESLSTPVLIGWDGWLESQGLDVDGIMRDRRDEVADALDSVVIGKASERRRYDLLMSKLTGDDAKAFKDEWHDDNRSSMNNIGEACWKLADRLRETKDTATAS